MRGHILTPTLALLFVLSSFFVFAQDDGNISVRVERMEDTASIMTVAIMAVFFVVLLVIFFFLLRYTLLEQKKKRALKEKVDAMDSDEAEYYMENREEMEEEEKPAFSVEEDVDKYLKEDEIRVVNILRQRGGLCSQSTLRIAGNFSKATLSRILMELEQRNVIKKEKRGKKNLVILR